MPYNLCRTRCRKIIKDSKKDMKKGKDRFRRPFCYPSFRQAFSQAFPNWLSLWLSLLFYSSFTRPPLTKERLVCASHTVGKADGTLPSLPLFPTASQSVVKSFDPLFKGAVPILKDESSILPHVYVSLSLSLSLSACARVCACVCVHFRLVQFRLAWCVNERHTKSLHGSSRSGLFSCC